VSSTNVTLISVRLTTVTLTLVRLGLFSVGSVCLAWLRHDHSAVLSLILFTLVGGRLMPPRNK